MDGSLFVLVLLGAVSAAAEEVEHIDVAIIGGGPTGLALAIALAKAPALASRRVVVFERDDFAPKGAIVGISPMAWAALENIDATVARRVRRRGSVVREFCTEALDADAQPFEPPPTPPKPPPPPPPLSQMPPSPTRREGARDRARGAQRAVARAAGTATRWLLARLGLAPQPHAAITFRWHDVRSELRRRARELLGQRGVRGGHELVALDADAQNADAQRTHVQLAFARTDRPDGPPLLVAARAVIACDGMRSSARALSKAGPRASALWVDEGKSIWRGIVPSLELRAVSTYFVEPGGNGRIAMLFPAGSGQGASWAVTAPRASGRAADGDDARARLRAALPARVHPALAAAILRSGDVLESALVSRNWSVPYTSHIERLAYAGDAAHPLRPTGQGLALALEDAWTLGRIAAETDAAVAEPLAPAALRAYEARREARVRAVSLAVNELAQLSYAAGDPRALGMREPPPIEGYGPL
ncbi:hypothetical protein KFE25_010788 [Diacronema lutheri]|uniref:FAD-binding domain-containing protein n=2 Tax=Diacronema lutheri TaxID=2081491 RepID=A0A8J6CAR1_DIALT|nr:hypothetical protein KFE25_010788 [Diacronema lutheri]